MDYVMRLLGLFGPGRFADKVYEGKRERIFIVSGDWKGFSVIFRVHVCPLLCHQYGLFHLQKLGLHTEFLRIMNYKWQNNFNKQAFSFVRWSSELVYSFNKNHYGYAHVAVWMITMLFHLTFLFFNFWLFKVEK